MNRFTQEIELGNEAMHTRGQVARALALLAERLQQTGRADGIVRDDNGNTVGAWEFTDVPAPEEDR